MWEWTQLVKHVASSFSNPLPNQIAEQYAPLLLHNRRCECTLLVPIKRGNVSQSKASEKVLLLLAFIKMTYERAKAGHRLCHIGGNV
jgi:hypothetical protein